MRLVAAVGSSALALALAVGCGSGSGGELFGAGLDESSMGGGGNGTSNGSSGAGVGGEGGQPEGAGGTDDAGDTTAPEDAGQAGAGDDAEPAGGGDDAGPDVSVGGDDGGALDAAGDDVPADAGSGDGSAEVVLVPGEVPCGSKTCEANKESCCAAVVTLGLPACTTVPCLTGVSFACDEPADCPSGQVCCGQVGLVSGFYQVACRDTCDPNLAQTTLCDPKNPKCPGGMSCAKDSNGKYFICKK